MAICTSAQNTQHVIAGMLPRLRGRALDVCLLTLVVLVGYFLRLSDLTIRGEESRRARVACEMIETGDWIVPRQQGQIYLSRPPLGSWPIAMLGILRGQVDVVAVRLPTVMAVLLTTLLVYAYAQSFLTNTAALASALAFATMGQVLEMGRLAETEGVFTLLISASLLVWHWGYERERQSGAPNTTRPAAIFSGWYWPAGYALSALAGLAKGPQGPVYFAAPVVIYLCLGRDWRSLFSRAHAVGMVAFLLVLGAWQVPYFLRTNWECCVGIWCNNAAERFAETTPAMLAQHMLRYPVEVFACMLPWSAWLLAYINPRFRARLGSARRRVYFLALAVAVAFPSVWLAVGAKSRYFMPVYPLAAVLIGVVLERSVCSRVASEFRRWRHFALAMAVVSFAAAGAVTIASWGDIRVLDAIAQAPGFALLFAVLCTVAGVILVHLERSPQPNHVRLGLAMVALFLVLLYVGPVLNAQVRTAEDTRAAVARLKANLPPGSRLVSLDRVHHLFAYHFAEAIPIGAHLQERGARLPAGTYFCFDEHRSEPKELPFGWQRVAEISMERNHTAQPDNLIVVGRVLPEYMASRGDMDATRTR